MSEPFWDSYYLLRTEIIVLVIQLFGTEKHVALDVSNFYKQHVKDFCNTSFKYYL